MLPSIIVGLLFGLIIAFGAKKPEQQRLLKSLLSTTLSLLILIGVRLILNNDLTFISIIIGSLVSVPECFLILFFRQS